MKGQSKKHSALEAVLNVIIGYWIAVGAQTAIFPMFGVHIPFSHNMAMGGLFTIISLVRSYWLRRFFNHIHTRYPQW